MQIASPQMVNTASSSWLGINRIWIVLVIIVPIIPKVAIMQSASLTLLLDDFSLISGVMLGWAGILVRGLIHGKSKIWYSQVGTVLSYFVLYKLTDFFILSLVYPWGGIGMRGSALLFSEGILVLVRVFNLAMVYFLMHHYLRDRQDVYFALRVYGISVGVVVLGGLFQHFILGHPVMTSTFRNIHVLGQIIPGVWGAENPWTDPSATGHEHLGAFMVLTLSIIGGCLFYQWPSKPGHRRLLTAFYLCCLFVLLMTSSRGAWVGGLASGMALSFIAVRQRKFTILFRIFLLLALALAGLYIVGFDFYFHIGQRVEKLPAILEGKVLDDSGQHRIHLLKILWQMFIDKPLLGWGAGGAGRIAEGQFMRELVEGGIIGLGLFLALMFTIIKVAFKANRTTELCLLKGLSLGLICGVVGYMGHCLFTELFILPKVSVPFWVLTAVVHRLYFIEKQMRGEI